MLLLEQVSESAILAHLNNNVVATNKLLVDVELGNGGPLAILLDACSELRVLEHIVSGKLGRINALVAQDLDAVAAESTSRSLRGALHEQDHRSTVHSGVNSIPDLSGHEAARETRRNTRSRKLRAEFGSKLGSKKSSKHNNL